MTLPILIAVLVVAGAAAWIVGRHSDTAPRWIVIGACALDLVLLALAWRAAAAGAIADAPLSVFARGGLLWILEYERAWIPEFGIRLHFAADGMALVLVALTLAFGIIATVASFQEIRHGIGFFHLNLSWILAGIVGVFTAVDLFLFYFAWELMLVPMYFLIALWGHERRVHAALKFFLFTQLSGLLMLIAILALVFLHHEATGTFSFEYVDLARTDLSPVAARWIMLGFFVAFAVKLPMFPLHTWLPDAHTEAPTAGSIVLAALLLKTGAYGLIRFVLPMFTEAARELAPVVQALAVVGVVYGAVAAFAQTDLKRMVAYTSVSHLGFVLLGIFAGTPLALQGALVQMVSHALSTGALFFLVGALQARLGTRDIASMGGLWAVAPRLGGAMLFFAMASLGLPGLGDFVGELLVLLGTFVRTPTFAAVAALGVLGATFYGLRLLQGVFHGPNEYGRRIADMNRREWGTMLAMGVALLWLGTYPNTVLYTVRQPPAVATTTNPSMAPARRPVIGGLP